MDNNLLCLEDRGFIINSYTEFKYYMTSFPLFRYLFEYEHSHLKNEEKQMKEFILEVVVTLNDENLCSITMKNGS